MARTVTQQRESSLPSNLMYHALETARRGIALGQSPFGAAIATLDGQFLVAAHNTVRATCDATAHAEINAIREACRLLGRIDLSGCVMAATCEPCPMCAAATHWARIDEVYYGASIADAAEAGFRELAVSCNQLLTLGGSDVRQSPGILTDDCRRLFHDWRTGPHAEPY